MEGKLNADDMALIEALEDIDAEEGTSENLYDLFLRMGRKNIICVFGDSGVGKSKTSCQLALDARKTGVAVTYWDTENGVGDKALKSLKDAGVRYVAEPDENRFCSEVATREPGGLIIVDSATLYITGKWFGTKMNARGALHQRLQSMCHRGKQWANAKDGMIVMIAQPRSQFTDGEIKTVAPMGDKWTFYSKTVLHLKSVKREDGTFTRRTLKIFKSRDVKDGTVISDFKTTATGIELNDWDNAWEALDR